MYLLMEQVFQIRPRTSTIEENADRVNELIGNDRRVTVHDIAFILDMSSDSVGM